MIFLLRGQNSDTPSLEQIADETVQSKEEGVVINQASTLLEIYLDTEESSTVMPLLQKIRDEFLQDLDQVENVKEIYGLIYWLLADNGVEHRGESLEETADRLGDIDIENDSDLYTDIIFHLKDAVERIYDIELE